MVSRETPVISFGGHRRFSWACMTHRDSIRVMTTPHGTSRPKPGAMYRPATSQVHDAIVKLMREQGMSWNAAVHYLVVKGLRLQEIEHAAVPSNAAGRRYAK